MLNINTLGGGFLREGVFVFRTLRIIWCAVVFGGSALSCSVERRESPYSSHLHLVGGVERLGSVVGGQGRVTSQGDRDHVDDSQRVPPWLVQTLAYSRSSSKLRSFSLGGKGVFFLPYKRVVEQTHCGGVLLNETTILTARHCYYPYTLTQLVTGTLPSFALEHIKKKKNTRDFLLTFPGSARPLWHVLPPGSLELNGHADSDLALMTSQHCRFYDADAVESSVYSANLNERSQLKYRELRAYGSGGSYAYEKTNILATAGGFVGLHPQLWPELYQKVQAPKPLPSMLELCTLMQQTGCLKESHACYQEGVLAQNGRQTTPQRCRDQHYQYFSYLLKAKQRLIWQRGDPWPGITETFRGLKDNILIYDPQIHKKSNAEKAFFCRGDSGGAVVNKWGDLVGILSSNIHSAEPLDPSLPQQHCAHRIFAVDVAQQISWLKSQLQAAPDSSDYPLCRGQRRP